MSDPVPTIDRLLEKSRELKNGPERIAVLEEAVRLADEQAELDAGFRARLELIEAATFGGRPDILLDAFSWCLTEHDRNPERFERSDLLWKYKWVVGNVVEFPHIPRAQIETMLADMERRFEEAGSTLHAVHQSRRDILDEMGDFDGARQATAELAATKRDWLSDCRACVYDATAGHLAMQARDPETLAEAEPILQGRLKCTHVPHRTYSKLLLPLLRLGRADEAREFHQTGYQLIGDNPEFLGAAGQHLEYLAFLGEMDEAIEVVQTHLPNALASPSALKRMKFYGALWFLLVRLSDEGRPTLRLQLPASFPLFEPRGEYPVAALRNWFQKETKNLAAQFDQRNGNDYYMRWHARRWRLPDNG